ncbi:hypothetical protein FDG2_3387 [Candidatus Protofrankia californiensis]|uniref:Uncharacterized protein n=1 Tax=Candidatus Protofrankia californiensis TaxID=1839754 RepID=A0A1C3NZM3_9ACTN|nr:hypothetical protein FDG2_3387 [Candidatus Protofrankia californiensis]
MRWESIDRSRVVPDIPSRPEGVRAGTARVVPAGIEKRPVFLKPVDGTCDDVAQRVGLSVKDRWPSTSPSAPDPVPDRPGRLGDSRLDRASSQVETDHLAGARRTGHDLTGTDPGPTAPRHDIQMVAVTGAHPRLSWRCPTLVTHARGRQQLSAARGIFVASPPGESSPLVAVAPVPSTARSSDHPAPYRDRDHSVTKPDQGGITRPHFSNTPGPRS